MSGRLPTVELGFRPQGGTSRFCQQACLLTFTSQRGRRREQLARGLFLSTVHFLSQLWETMHQSIQFPTRERRPQIRLILASSVCDFTHTIVRSRFNIKTNHIPRTNLPTLLISLEHSFIMTFNLRGLGFFSILVLDIMK